MTRAEIGIAVLAVFVAVFCLAFYAAVGVIAWHFIRKAW